jgi:hypothetical protein
MSSKGLTKTFPGIFGGGFIEPHAKLGAKTLLDFAIHRKQNETLSRKSTRVKTMRVISTVSHGRLMQQACVNVTLASPSSSFADEVK